MFLEQDRLLNRTMRACNIVADRLKVSAETRKMMHIAARSAPVSALACYRAIINSYKEK